MHSFFVVAVHLVLSQAKPLDIAELKDKLSAVTDGKGHYLVFEGATPLSGNLFASSDGKTFYKVPVIGGGASGEESFDISFWDPRITHMNSSYASFDMKDSGKTYTVTCGRRATPVKAVDQAELKKLLEGQFMPARWTRRPERLLRDDSGTYYFVDRLRTSDEEDRRDFRVFVGPRGKMKQLPLKDIVDDSKGTILATKTGDLRLISSPQTFTWIGPKKVQLTDVPVEDNARMIYSDLGPYTGAPLGTPCDDLL
jgi:hypothetical protein